VTTVYVNTTMDDDTRRQHVYAGDLFVIQAVPSSLALCEFADKLSRKAFSPLNPREAQHHMSVEEYAAKLAELKPLFIHHPESKRLIQGLLREVGCDLEKTYFDVPRMRTSTSDGYLTSGIAYAFHPHRDTWYSAPSCQLNWWLPIYDIEAENTVAFHPRYFDQPVQNGSRDYNYQEWNKTSRKEAAKHIKKDTRQQPRPEEPIELDPQIRFVCPPGSVVLFSGAHMHSSVPNTSGRTRFSIDFRTVHVDDVLQNRGAPNVDSECTGTTLGDYLRGTDLAHIPENVVAQYL
jgi:Phytanoyl-CoA dioxygenase (PhyH)